MPDDFISLNSTSRVNDAAAVPRVSARTRLSSPEQGRSLGATVARIDAPIRAAVNTLINGIDVDPSVSDALFDCTRYGNGAQLETSDERIAWFVVAAALTHALATARTAVAPLTTALTDFFGSQHTARSTLACFSKETVRLAEDFLTTVHPSDELRDLLPYVFEPHGHVTRSQLHTSVLAKQTWSRKKRDGVYYTPSDVADFLVACAAMEGDALGTWLDPACGTGVLIRSVLSRRRSSTTTPTDLGAYFNEYVFGVDKSALATDLAAFVVLTDCIGAHNKDTPPIALWRRIKSNLICMDALRLVPVDGLLRPQLQKFADDAITQISQVFPDRCRNGFDHVVMNPPYTTTNVDASTLDLWHSLTGATTSSNIETSLPFAEMLFRIANRNGRGAAILPLAVGTNTSRSHQNFRAHLMSTPGVREFLFFDREPQALFGEDIKTRTLVLTCQPDAAKVTVRTSRLLKWTAQQRPSIFSRDRLVEIDTAICKRFVPKLGSIPEVEMYSLLRSTADSRLTSTPLSIEGMSLASIVAAEEGQLDRTILVSSTAYNFLSCYFASGLPKHPSLPYSASSVHALTFSSSKRALAAFALLSSRLVFWLWHVEGDGFHVTAEFLKRLPIWRALDDEVLCASLSHKGLQLWEMSRTTAIRAVNAGKQTYSFSSDHNHALAKEVELLLTRSLALDINVSGVIDHFLKATVSVDGKRRSRH